MNNDIVHTEQFNGYTINILLDTDAQNPFDDWDCNPPLVVDALYNTGVDCYAKQYGDANSIPSLTREQIIANKSLIFDLFDVSSWFALREVRQYTDVNFAETLNDELSNILHGMSNFERLEALCSLYNACGIPAVVSSVSGHSQGDYAKVLAVATPEFQEACGNGADYDWIESLKGSIELFGNWAFGNVYGYQVLDANDEEIDSCWGFYGDYDKPFGAVHEAQAAINWHITYESKRRIEQIKTWIRAKVPFQYRTFA